jgi:OmpA-OmpF porin, OOP family
MSKNSNMTLVLALAVTASLGVGGVWFLSKFAPNLLPGISFNQSPSQGNQPTNPQSSVELTILGDSFSGYSTFRNADFQTALQDTGITLRYQDEFDQAKRAKVLGEGNVDLLVTTLDQFLKQNPKGKIVGLIDRTVGADAVILNTKKYPTLKSLLDLNQLVKKSQSLGKPLEITFAADTPSEYLALVLDTKFEAFNLKDLKVMPVGDASESWKLLQDSTRNVGVAIIWEPFVTQARQKGYTVVLSSADAPTAIVDVLVASDRLIQSRPAQLTEFLETYYRRIDTNVRDASALQGQIAQDGQLSPTDAAAVLNGIQFFTATEAQSWLTNGTLERRIGSTAAVLVLAGRLTQVPPKPADLFSSQFIKKAASNTQVLIDLVRADSPELADKLSGKKTAITASSPLTAAQVKAAPDIGNLQVRGKVSFATGATQLTLEGQKALDGLVKEINEFSAQSVAVRVIGHTSRTGSADVNQQLSQQRAAVVVNYLRGQGVSHNIASEGKSFTQPLPGIAPADERNQRTEIRMVRVNNN